MMSSTPAEFLKAQKTLANRRLKLSVAAALGSGLILIAQALLLAHVVNAVIFNQQQLNDVMAQMFAMLGLLVARSVLVQVAERQAFLAAATIKQHIRQQLYAQIRKLGPAWTGAERSGELATVMTDGVEALEAYYARYLPAMAMSVFLPLVILAFVLPIDWRSAVVFLLTAPLIPFFMILIGKGAERLNQQQWQKLQRMGGHFLDVIQGLTTLKLFAASRREAQLVARISEDYRLATMKVLRIAFLSSLALEFFATVSIAIVAVLIGFRLLFGEMDFYSGFFVLLLAPEFYLPLRNLGTQYHARLAATAAAEKMQEILATPLPQAVAGNRTLTLTAPPSITFEAVDFAYTDQKKLFKSLTLHIHAGETLAIVGASGAGKTSLANLLLGFLQPQQGSVLINQQNLAETELTDWHRQLAWLPQQPRLIHATVRQNIALGLPSVALADIKAAASEANALDFILQLPEGFDTLIGEGARQLSGGQIQRLLLARAFLRRPTMLIMDEPTASLDRQTEALVQQALARLTQQSTSVIIAHRLQTVQQADRIVVLQQGEIVESGSHQQLLERQGHYWALLQAQGSLL